MELTLVCVEMERRRMLGMPFLMRMRSMQLLQALLALQKSIKRRLLR